MNAARRLTLAMLVSLCSVAGVQLLGAAPALAGAPETPEALAPVPLTASTATLQGVLNPGKAGAPGTFELDAYEFVYRQSSAECRGEGEVVTPAGLSLGGGKEAVSQGIEDLLPGTQYTVCLVVHNEEQSETATSAPVSFTTLGVAPKIEEESVSDVASTSATLYAQVDPGGPAPRYTFEYAPAGGTFTPVPGAEGSGSIAAGLASVTLSVHVDELQPGTAYEFHVVVGNSVETVTGEAVSFSTQRSGGEFILPDGRAYEMVSPPEKEGALIEAAYRVDEAAAGGDAVTYGARVPTEADPQGYNNQVQVRSTRGPSGWSTRDLTLPNLLPTGPHFVLQGSEYAMFSSDLAAAAVQPFETFVPCVSSQGAPQPCLSPDASEATAFLEELGTGVFAPLVTGCPLEGACPPSVEEHADVPPGTVFGGRQGANHGVECSPGDECGPEFVAATPDLSHVVLASAVGLTSGSGSHGGLYEWSGGRLTFIGKGENESENNEGAYAAHGAHGISADGSRVIFRGKSENAEHESIEGLLMRDTATEEAVRLGEGEFQTASADDSRVFFDTGWETGQLDVFELTSRPGEPLAGRVTELTEGQGLRGLVLGTSEDGAYVYFVSEGVLAGSGASSPGDNLYVDHYDAEEEKWQPAFIAALSSGDSHDWDGVGSLWGATYLLYQPTRVSPNGQWLTFMSEASLTGYDNRDTASPLKSDAEVYLYHASASGGAPTLTCASCDPTGARPTGVEYEELKSKGVAGTTGEAWNEQGLVAASLPGWRQPAQGRPEPEGYQPRYLSDSGRLFFDSPDALVPQDVNGTEDVYEYEPEGVPAGEHACSAAGSSGSEVFESAHEFRVAGREGQEGAGCVALISSGDSSEESGFIDASESGSDVFFVTAAKLAPQDTDTAYDVYDAHECTSASPCTSAPVQPPPCDTEASCKPSPTPQPAIYGAPASATFVGPGNLAAASLPAVSRRLTKKAAKCRRGYVKNGRGKCVRSRSKQRKAKRARRAGNERRAKS
jgi:hypothetical protein